MKRKLMIVVGVTAIVAAIVVVAFLKDRGIERSTPDIVVDANFPLSGPIALAGKSFQEAAMLALEDIKAKGGPYIAFDWSDNSGSPAEAASVASRQVEGYETMFLVGYGPSVLASKAALEPEQEPIFAFSFMASITKDPLVYRSLINYKVEYPLFLEYAKRLKAKKIAIIHMDQPEAHEQFKQLLIPALVENGWMESDLQLYPYALSETEFRSVATKISNELPDLIIVNGYRDTIAPVIQALHNAKLVKDGNVIGTFDLLDVPDLIGADLVEGMAVACPTYLLKPSDKTIEFQRRFFERYGRKPSYNDFAGYDFVLILADLAGRLPPNPSAKQVREAI
jgi:ABC-type branched-subunit amino acid transport system substrate-binding protein